MRYVSYNREMSRLLKERKIEEFNALRPQEKERGDEINLEGVDFSGCCLAKANLYGANLRHANFSDANLRDTILRDTDLYAAKFDNAVMIDTDLVGAQVGRVDFSKVNIFYSVNICSMCGLSQQQQDLLIDKLKQTWNWNEGPQHISQVMAELLKERGLA